MARAKSDNSGQAAVMLGVFGGVMLLGISAAIDILGANDHHQSLQDQLDAAVLAGASDGIVKADEMKKFIDTMLENKPEVTVVAVGNELIATASQPYDKVLSFTPGGPQVQVSVESGTNTGRVPPVEVTLVMDVTYSMRANLPNGQRRIDGALEATDALLRELGWKSGVTIDPNTTAVRVSVVPFSRYMRLPASERLKPWVDMSTATSPATWDGCVGTKRPLALTTPDLDTTNKVYALNHEPDIVAYGHCVGEPFPPSFDLEAARKHLRDTEVNGDTHLPEGLRWGWRMLSPNEPFPNVRALDKDVRRIMVVMTDGLTNTYADDDGKHRTMLQTQDYYEEKGLPRPTGLGERDRNEVSQMCEAIKDDGIELAVIAYTINESAKSHYVEMLKGCATNKDMYFNPQTAENIVDVFTGVGKRLKDIRLTR